MSPLLLCHLPPTPYALCCIHLHPSVTLAALYLLQCLKVRFPATKGSLQHCIFILVFMVALKIICDDTYSNKSWSIVGQAMFMLWEIDQMVCEVCFFLKEW